MPARTSTPEPGLSETLGRIVKAYDVRGLVEGELTTDVVARLGAAAGHVLAGDSGTFVVGHDMRPSSPTLADVFAEAVASRGVDVAMVGLTSTDGLYFASGHLDAPGAMFTASHNPAEYNGLKLCRAGAVPVSIDSELAEIRDLAVAGVPPAPSAPGRIRHEDTNPRFAAHVRSFVDRDALHEIRIAVDAANGMAGLVVPLVFDELPVEILPLYFELDGTFPNHPADPIDAANLVDLREAVTTHGLPLGLAFDGDADRMFAVDETGAPVPSSLVGAVVADRLVARNPGATVLYNLICSKVVPETIEAAGGRAVRTRVGHSFIKARMAETQALFAVEHSGHYYFRDNYRADSGLIAALLLLEAVAAADAPLSEVVAPYARYAPSGEINFRVDDVAEAIARVERELADEAEHVDREDGLTVDVGSGWLNLRPSNTEPLLRLNVEAADRPGMESLRDRVTAAIRSTR